MTDVVLVRGDLVTMNARRHIISDGAVAISDTEIVGVGRYSDLHADHPTARVTGQADDLVVPGYVNAHQHLTGDRLVQSSIPDNLAPGESILGWAVPIHAQHTPDNDLLSATLTLAEGVSNGITTTVEAGTVAHPDQVAEAARRLGVRITLGPWGWDVEDGPFAAPAHEVIERQRSVLAKDHGPLVTPWVTLVGHDLMSDELVTAASALAREHGTGLTFHLSPSPSDPERYLARTQRRPVDHLATLGVLGSELLIAHAVHLDDREIDLIVESRTAVTACPWAYLRLGQGTTRQFRHLDLWRRGGRVALGCDAENAGDAVDGLRTAALFTGLAKDVAMDPTGFGAHEALELLTIAGAEAIGMDDRIGSLEVGKQADLVVHDRNGPSWHPHSDDPVLQLVWGSDGRSVRDVFVAGRQVVEGGVATRIDSQALATEARSARRALLERSGVVPGPRWPYS
ncbi:MAG: amidohydrolase family protein [Actinomycetia bacterium]|nr:amidohydrolase family protein [Actinomycetes bacterium]